jgi:lipopolysaccharide transport system permease protein
MNPHDRHPTSLGALLTSLWHNRRLVADMTRREVVGRYRGSIVGLAWSFFNPVLLLIVYTLVFSGVFKSRWGVGVEETKTDFAIVLFVGMIMHGFFAECIGRASGLIVSNVSLVKKVVFPLELLPWIAAFSALYHMAVSLCVLMVAQLVLNQQFPLTAVLFPLVLIPLILLTMGASWFLAATGVYIRDIAQATGIVTTVLLFLSPVFYPVASVPPELRLLLLLNPLTFIIESARQVLIFGNSPSWTELATYSAGSLAVAWAGFWWFQRTRKGFADVL